MPKKPSISRNEKTLLRLKKVIATQKDEIFRLNHIINELPGDVYWKDEKGVYLGMNKQGMESMRKMGFPSHESEIVNKTDYDLFDKETADLFRKNDLYVMKTGSTKTKEESATLPSGKKIIQLSTKRPLFDKQGKVVGIVGNAFDITAIKNLEKKLNRSKIKAESASQAKSAFIANMSHDIRTPITGMLGMAQDLLRAAKKTKSALEQIQIQSVVQLIETVERDSQLLISGINELLELCNEILEVARLESGKIIEKPESFNLRELVEHIRKLLCPMAQHKKLILTSNIDPSVPTHVNGFRIYFARILLNLISNALKFTANGFVKVELQLKAAAMVKKRHHTGETITLETSVKDSGIGIPKEKFDIIFEHFSRLSPAYHGLYEGTGLGLYTVKRYVEAMNGKITVDSTIGEGTCFTLTIPFTVSDHADRIKTSTRSAKKIESFIPPPPELAGEEASQHTTIATILVVEDSTVVSLILKSFLQDLHCSVDVAKNGVRAIQMAGKGHYDLILMDIGLPDFSGIEVTKKIRALSDAQKSQVPIVALTGHGDVRKKHHVFLNAGMQEILNKPVQLTTLQSILQHYVFNKKSIVNRP